MVWSSSCQIFKINYSGGETALKNRLDALHSDGEENGLEVTPQNSFGIDGDLKHIHTTQGDFYYKYSFNLSKNYFILNGRGVVRGNSARVLMQRVFGIVDPPTSLLEMLPESAYMIGEKLIIKNKNNKIIKPKFDFGSKGYDHKDGTNYKKFEFTLGEFVCARCEHQDFLDFFINCESFDFKAWVKRYDGIIDETSGSKGSKLSVRGGYSFHIYRDIGIEEWDTFIKAITDNPF